ncbi:MarR family winged helix-turn-helix transcriptional regulator [Paenibacillus sacheonensis]|uniref:MarR family transcriptional regulator n=1 Tax=Paenibacillus sacheonensis TaxID=742054 RepID=A0A7X5BUU8_9BACL|nr:MarR family winged helix-turn-helix transcriptional regulator [Paenibacillus sacheonensis]MBM7563895.1 DNA-binding MarR family transcriptional regulator [Paenibacillus sacheonensis]NBC67758.1 MarR family transcriptional regulator [Paenibacillus sacheonensis]
MSNHFDIPALCNATKLRRATRHLTRFYDACLAGTGLRVTQYAILGHLKRQGPKTMNELAELMAMDRATIGHNLRPLERDELVRIQVSETDRRARIVSITETGLERFLSGRSGWERAQAEFESKFGAEHAQSMRKMMDDVVLVQFDS